MKRHMFWLIEVLVWLLILVTVSGIIIFTTTDYRRSLSTYQLFLPDVDGLINGSPVKLMGIQIGYVNQLNIVGDDIYLKFIITSPNVKLPPGTFATVEFSGLGGSKSLELYPPEAGDNISGKLIIPEKPKRIHDCLGLLYEMFNNVVKITYEASHFMNQLVIINKGNHLDENSSPSNINDILNYSNNWLDKLQKRSDNISNKIKSKAGEKNGKFAGKN